MDPYREAHLYVGAIRVLEHQKHTAPAIDDLCPVLRVSSEEAHAVCRRLNKAGIVELVEDPFTVKVTVADHLLIENLPRQEQDKGGLAKELEQFMNKKKDLDKKVETLQADLERKKKAMFSDLEEKLKKSMKKEQ